MGAQAARCPLLEPAAHFDDLAVQGEAGTGAVSWSSKIPCGSGHSILGNFSSKRAQRFQRSIASSFLGGWIFSAASKCRIASWNITVTACDGRAGPHLGLGLALAQQAHTVLLFVGIGEAQEHTFRLGVSIRRLHRRIHP